MKLLAIAVALTCVYQAVCQSNVCLKNCKNLARNPLFCVFASNRCNDPIIRLSCALTCKVCTLCDDDDTTPRGNEIKDECEIEDCVDLAPPDQCDIIKNTIPNGCSIYPDSCRASCGQCTPCPIPDPVAPCSISCEDFDDSCEHWKSQGYCNETSEFYPFTSQECPLSCGICEQCPTPPSLNTALPPTELTCSENCEDKEESCAFWKEEGYCNMTDEFPTILEVCSLSCGTCIPCPVEEPTPPPCSEDCEDSNDNCEFWQEQGHCNETSDFPFVREVCLRSCGVCTACPDEEDRSTALPPTKEESEAAAQENE